MTQIGIHAEQFNRVFPFHLAVGRELEVQHVGSTLQRLAPEILLGVELSNCFSLVQPAGGQLKYEWLVANQAMVVLLQHKTTELQLRGGIEVNSKTGQLLFLVSPWLVDADQLEKLGLGLDDFAAHDAMADLLMVLQLNKQMVRDGHSLAGKLEIRQQELSKVNLQLEARVEQRTSELNSTMKKLSEFVEYLNELVSSSPAVLYRQHISKSTPNYISPNISALLGWCAEDIIEDTSFWTGLVHPEDQPDLNQLYDELFSQDRYERTYRLQHKNGSYRRITDRIRLLRDDLGEPAQIVGALWDITQQAQIEHRLREVQKLEAIGQLTGGLAHDFNNLLGIVVGNLDLLLEDMPKNDLVARKRLNIAQDAALRGAQVTRSLLAVARRQPLEVYSHNLNTLVEEMMPLMRSSAGSAVKVRCKLATGELKTQLDKAGLSNVVLNLLINARDAMDNLSGNKVLTIVTRSEQVLSPAFDTLTPGYYAVLEVSDNGIGMNEAVREKAFEPFFTTKERGRGTGLGLAMVYGYAKQLGGTARIVTAEGAGTKVMIYLPMEAEPADEVSRQLSVS
jgi:PAS domain S-box-containing protein